MSLVVFMPNITTDHAITYTNYSLIISSLNFEVANYHCKDVAGVLVRNKENLTVQAVSTFIKSSLTFYFVYSQIFMYL